MSSKTNILLQIKDISDRIESEKLPPVAVLQGAEGYFIDKALELLENRLLTESEKAFNLSVFYGKEIHATDLIATCRRLPMMSKHQVVILKEAQQCRSLEQLEKYMLDPVATTKLIVVYRNGKIRSNSKLGKSIKKHLVFSSEEIRDYEIPAFVHAYGADCGLKISSQISQLFVEFFGNKVQLIAHTIDRIKNSLRKGEDTISEGQFFHFASIDKEYNIYELQQAIGKGNFEKTMKILQFFGQNPKKVPPVVVISSLFNFFSKTLIAINQPSERFKMNKAIQNFATRMNSEKIIKNIEVVRKIDLQAKGIIGNQRSEFELLKELGILLEFK